jgi:serine/threonine-protein kinase RsbW
MYYKLSHSPNESGVLSRGSQEAWVTANQDVDIEHSSLVRLAGEVDMSGCEAVTDVMSGLLEWGCASPRVDLAGVRFMDTSGLRTVLEWREEFHRNDLNFEVVSVNPAVKRLFESAGLSEVICQSEECCEPVAVEREPITDCAAVVGDWAIRSFSVAATLRSCKTVRDRVDEIAAGIPFSVEERGDIKVAVGEAMTNAVRHGSRSDVDRVSIQCMASNNALVVEVSDGGPGFDLGNAAGVTEPGTMIEGGMGITCMRRSVDEVTFHFGHGTTVTLVKRLGKNSES